MTAEPPHVRQSCRQRMAASRCRTFGAWGFLVGMRLRMDAWRPLLDLNRVDHRLMLPTLLYCVDPSVRPMLGFSCRLSLDCSPRFECGPTRPPQFQSRSPIILTIFT
jgi:hypothetical protein